ncbi:MAG: hypothetical protein JSV04_02150 [Candidatus Heimdallarchaeota archaeon]|nr:MAG: hypothetical protein JSV04_02150 [Candidatus Heimdallarchaeota archaeon]
MSEETLKIDEIIPTIEKVKLTIDKLTKELEEKQQEAEEREKLLAEREAKLNEAQIQQQQLEASYASLENELKKISDLYNEMSSQQEATLDVKQLLSIYITLLEKVFEGKPHAKILYLLHGGKSEMTRQELTKATGFSAAIVLHSLHELNRAELISYDEEQAKAILVNRIF